MALCAQPCLGRVDRSRFVVSAVSFSPAHRHAKRNGGSKRMVDVFVSYAREDQAFAQRIAHAAAREGYDVWWDDDLPPHLSYGEVITEKIGNAKAAIVVWSHRSAESEWVRAEADLARSQKKLIQTSIDDRQPPMPFNQIQFASI